MEQRKSLIQRIDFLRRSGIISDIVFYDTERAAELLLGELTEEADADSVTAFVTHFAMAAQRMENGEEAEKLDNETANALKNEKAYPEAQAALEKILKHGAIHFLENEKEFLIVHLCNIFNKSRKEA